MNVKETRERAELMLKACKIAEERGQEYFDGVVQGMFHSNCKWHDISGPQWVSNYKYRINPECLKRVPKNPKELKSVGFEHTKGMFFEVFAVNKRHNTKIIARVKITLDNEIHDKVALCGVCYNDVITLDSFCYEFIKPDGSDFYIKEE